MSRCLSSVHKVLLVCRGLLVVRKDRRVVLVSRDPKVLVWVVKDHKVPREQLGLVHKERKALKEQLVLRAVGVEVVVRRDLKEQLVLKVLRVLLVRRARRVGVEVAAVGCWLSCNMRRVPELIIRRSLRL